MSETKRDRILDKIRKLLAKTTDRGASEAEMETALRIAGELMEKYNVEEGDLFVEQGEDATKLNVTEITLQDKTKLDRDEEVIAQAAAELTDCRLYVRQHWVRSEKTGKMSKKTALVAYGLETDVMLCLLVYQQCIIACRILARAKFPNKGQGQNREQYRYTIGFGQGLWFQIREQKAKQEKERTDAAASAGVLIVAKSTALTTYEQTKLSLGKAKATSRPDYSNSAGFQTGWSDGKEFEIEKPGKGVNGSTSKKPGNLN
jgi:hypothetical protein